MPPRPPAPEPGLLEQAAADGKTVRGAVRPDGSQVHLLSLFDVTGVRARPAGNRRQDQRDPRTGPAVAHLDLTGAVVTLDALHTQAETARYLVEDKHAHYLMIIKGNQPSLLGRRERPGRPGRGLRGDRLDRRGQRARPPRAAQHPHRPRRRHQLATRRPGPAHPP